MFQNYKWEKFKIKKISLRLHDTYKPSKEAIPERLLLKEKYMVNNKDEKYHNTEWALKKIWKQCAMVL